MTTQQALQQFETVGIDGMSIEDLDLVFIHWLENPSQHESDIKEYILFCSFGNYDLIKQEEIVGHKYVTRRHIYKNAITDTYWCLQFEEEMRMQERWDFQWFEVYPKTKTIVEYHRKQVQHMFVYGDLITERHNYLDAVHNIYMFVQSICVDQDHCIVYDIYRNDLVFKRVSDLVSRKKYVGNKSLEINLFNIANSSVYYQVRQYILSQQDIAKQKFVFLRDVFDRGVTIRVNGCHFRPTGVYFRPNNYVYWQDMIVFTGYSQVGHNDTIHLSTLLPNCQYLQKLVEID